MTFSRALCLLLLIGIATSALAADDQANSQPSQVATSSQLLGFASTNSPESSLAPSDPAQPSVRHLINPFDKRDAGGLQLLGLQSEDQPLVDSNSDVCYTMRSYKVKRTERLKDNESGRRGYSTCEMASSYRLRSTDAKVKEPADRK